MDLSRLKDQLSLHEGIRQKPYTDSVGKLTIGVGRNLTDRGLSVDEIAYLLNNDIKLVEVELDHNLPWWRRLSEIRQRVLADMCFNMGIGTLLTFKTFLGQVEAGDYTSASTSMLNSKWARQVGKRALRLSEMMELDVDKVP